MSPNDSNPSIHSRLLRSWSLRINPPMPSKGTASAFNSRGFLKQPLSDTRYTWQTKYRTRKNTEDTFGTGEYTFTLLGNPFTEPVAMGRLHQIHRSGLNRHLCYIAAASHLGTACPSSISNTAIHPTLTAIHPTLTAIYIPKRPPCRYPRLSVTMPVCSE